VNTSSRRWLDDNGLGDLDSHERTNAIQMVEREVEITAFRAGLSPSARALCNHPNTVINHLRAGTAPTKQGPKPKQVKQQNHEPDLDDAPEPATISDCFFIWPDEALRQPIVRKPW
jgi:hypothetical protein